MFGHEVFTIKMTALSRVTSLFPTETESQPSIMKARQKRSNNKLPLETEPISCDNKRFQKLSSRLKQLKIVVSVTELSRCVFLHSGITGTGEIY